MILTFVKDTLAELDKNKETIPTLEAFLVGRSQTDVYSIVYSRFIPCIASTRYYKEELHERLCNKDDTRELFTKSDEAFTLLILENYYERWRDIYKQNGGPPRQRVRS